MPGYPHVWEIEKLPAEADARTPTVPRPFHLQQLWIPILFSGQQREFDLQDQLEPLLPRFAGKILPLSLDIINDKILGDLMRHNVVARWIVLISSGAVIAMFTGPPCGTFSAARVMPLEDGSKGPPPLRGL